MTLEVVGSELEVTAAVILERAHGRDEHDSARRQAAGAADDVEELLQTEIRREASLGDDIVAELQRDPRRRERAVAVGDIRERPGVHKRRLTLERLDEVRLDRLPEQHRHGPGGRSCSAVTGSPSRVAPTVIAPSRARRSSRSRAIARIAITSDAAVMSNPVSRG